MRYVLLDRVIRIERGKKVLALKNASLAEDVYADHFIGFPVMPGALMIESAAQAGTVLIETSGGFEKKALLVMIEHAKFRALVRPGDQLTIAVTVETWDENYVRTQVATHVGDRPVMDARLVFGLKDVDDFYPLKMRYFVESVYDFWLKDAERIGFPE
jgi:3-hydroxyacyl-[acyl-carrier-protein] dehydratase